MAKYRVALQTVATTSIEIEVPDDVTDLDEIAELAAGQDMPTICAHCSGMFGHGPSLDMDDAWEVSEYNGEPLVERIDG